MAFKETYRDLRVYGSQQWLYIKFLEVPQHRFSKIERNTHTRPMHTYDIRIYI